MRQAGRPSSCLRALVEDILRKSDEAGPALVGAIAQAQAAKRLIRLTFGAEDDQAGPSEGAPVPTTCGIDDPYVLDHMLSMPTAACAAVVVGDFAPPPPPALALHPDRACAKPYLRLPRGAARQPWPGPPARRTILRAAPRTGEAGCQSPP